MWHGQLVRSAGAHTHMWLYLYIQSCHVWRRIQSYLVIPPNTPLQIKTISEIPEKNVYSTKYLQQWVWVLVLVFLLILHCRIWSMHLVTVFTPVRPFHFMYPNPLNEKLSMTITHDIDLRWWHGGRQHTSFLFSLEVNDMLMSEKEGNN